ncbi:MAG: serine hydrolase domain-containing protein [Phenylobacterium sp.]|uniref:serine hydrolase domain-containing protein n=1 Tax=Phenylobacterium sp. TaxID=1871053 RepID=UPI00391C76DE
MRRPVLIALTLLALWTVLVGLGARNGWMRQQVASDGDSPGFLQWASGRYEDESKGNIAILLLSEGRPAADFFASHGREVDEHTIFQVASLSKWLTAWGVMKLAEQGRVDLDAPVSRYLSRWRLPASEYDLDKVTVRRLLAHNSGLTDGLGFRGFEPGQALPSLEQELTKTTDVLPSADGEIRVGAEPGSGWRYSGGGYLILQLMIEEVSQESFEAFMRREIFEPLGMADSTFVDPDPSRLADIFDADGSAATHYRFAATGAASLYTSAADLSLFLQSQAPGRPNAPSGRGVLTPETLRRMATPQAYLLGLPIWGLGESLYAPTREGFVIGHDGQNYPAINTTARLDPATGNGVIVLTTGSSTLAREIGGEWTFWQTGKVGLDTLILFDARKILFVWLTGAIAIVVLTTSAAIMRRRRAQIAGLEGRGLRDPEAV